MSVTIAGLQKAEEIDKCEKLFISHKLWGTTKNVEAYGQMGYIAGREWIVKLTAHEANPLATYTQENDPVYRDSALEVFLNFVPDKDEYLNFEVNANGALLCHYGKKGPANRGPVSRISEERVTVEVQKEEAIWSVLLRIPFALIQDCFGDMEITTGKKISFNLYKISESQEDLHFISHTYIPSEKPDFHLPECFAEGVIG